MSDLTALSEAQSGEYLSFRLGNEEYGIPILTVQEIRGYQEPTLIANAPPAIKGVVNPRVDQHAAERVEQTWRPCSCHGANHGHQRRESATVSASRALPPSELFLLPAATSLMPPPVKHPATPVSAQPQPSPGFPSTLPPAPGCTYGVLRWRT